MPTHRRGSVKRANFLMLKVLGTARASTLITLGECEVCLIYFMLPQQRYLYSITIYQN